MVRPDRASEKHKGRTLSLIFNSYLFDIGGVAGRESRTPLSSRGGNSAGLP